MPARISHLPAQKQVPVSHRDRCDHDRGVETEVEEQEQREVVEAEVHAVIENHEDARAYVAVLKLSQ